MKYAQKKYLSPCFYLSDETNLKLESLCNFTNLSKSAVVEIAIGVLNGYDLQNPELRGNSKKGKDEYVEKSLFSEW